MKKIVSVVICIAMLMMTVSVGASAKAKDEKLKFSDDGNFKIFQISDMQDGYIMNSANKDFIRAAVIKEQPDLIVLTGDNISGGSCGLNITKDFDTLLCKKGINEFMSIFEELGVPVASVFGNHDDESNKLTKEDEMKIYEQYDCFIGEDEGDALYGCGTYNVPIYSSDSNKVSYNLWMIDSNTYDEELGGYDYVHDDQVEWYVNKSNELKDENGGVSVPSMAFQHIIVRKVFDAISVSDDYTQGAMKTDDGRYAVIKPEMYKTGYLREMPCPSTRYDKEFSSMKEQGDVVAMFFGHDHCNSFELSYQGIDLVATPACNFSDYSDETRGIRVININENDTTSYETHLINWNDVFGDGIIATAHYNMYACEVTEWNRIKAGLVYILLFPVKLLLGYKF